MAQGYGQLSGQNLGTGAKMTIFRVQMSMTQYRKIKENFRKIKTRSPGKFKYLGKKGSTFRWINDHGEKISATYYREEPNPADNRAIITFSGDDPNSFKLELFKEWVAQIGLTATEINEDEHEREQVSIKTRQDLEATERRKIAIKRFSDQTDFMVSRMRNPDPDRPPAPESYIRAYIRDRERMREQIGEA